MPIGWVISLLARSCEIREFKLNTPVQVTCTPVVWLLGVPRALLVLDPYTHFPTCDANYPVTDQVVCLKLKRCEPSVRKLLRFVQSPPQWLLECSVYTRAWICLLEPQGQLVLRVALLHQPRQPMQPK